MWNAAIEAILNNDSRWIAANRRDFYLFFEEQNQKPKGKLSPDALEHHYETKLFKLFLAKDLGGLELTLAEGARIIENAAALEGNWGWLLAIGVGGAYFADYLPRPIAKKYFLPREALVAGSGKPNGKANQLPNGNWQVSGSWSYCSGSEQASLFTAVTATESATLAVVLPVDEVEILEDWNAIGLPLTCSHTIEAINVEIPGDHFFDLGQQPTLSRYPLASYPFMLFARACFVPVIAGMSRNFWEETEIFLQEKEEVWKQYQTGRLKYIREKQQVYRQKMEKLQIAFYQSLEESWQHHVAGEEDSYNAVTVNGLEFAAFCFDSCAEIYPKLGMKVLEKDHPLCRCWLNLQTAWQHSAFHAHENEKRD